MNSTAIRHELLEFACKCYEELVKAHACDTVGFVSNADVKRPLSFPTSYSSRSGGLERHLNEMSAMIIKALSPAEQRALKPLLSGTLRNMKQQHKNAAKRQEDAVVKQSAMDRIRKIAQEIDREVADALRKINLNEMLECGEKYKACLPNTRNGGSIPEHVQITLTQTIRQTHYQCERSGITFFVDKFEVELRESVTVESLPQSDKFLVGIDELTKSVESVSQGKRPINFGDMSLIDPSKATTRKRDWFKVAKGGILITGNVIEGALNLLADVPMMDYPKTWKMLQSVLTGASDLKDGFSPKNN